MRIVFIGTGEIGVPTLRALVDSSEHQLVGVVTQPDKPAGRDQRIEPPAVKKAIGQFDVAYATSNCRKIPILQPLRIKDRQSIEQIHALQPDLIVVMAYGQILPHAVLEIPRLACLNLHASLLPKHRGAAPIQAAIIAGDRESGITVIYMDEGLDTGDILLQSRIEISPNETGGSLHDRLAALAPDAIHEALKLLQRGAAPRVAQDSANATYAPKLTRDDGKIDWSEPAELIDRKIRAFNPWPGAFTKFGARNLKIFSASIVDLNGRPGEILQSEKGLNVATGKGALSLREVQLEGKRRMSASEFLRGHESIGRVAD